MNTMQMTHDAIIIGGGPAGASAAILLAQAGWSVAIVEKKQFPRRKVCGEFISATSWPLLTELGVERELLERAGPEIRQVGFYSGDTLLAADMPGAGGRTRGWGRALGREHLDTMLLARAARAGAEILQPAAVSHMEHRNACHVCTVLLKEHGKSRELRARVIIAAHGSWEPGTLPTQQSRSRPQPSDLFAFKAHFRTAGLPLDLMPLLTFPGGYGGMVRSDAGRVSLSCCIRRDTLGNCRRRTDDTQGNTHGNTQDNAHAAASAGEAVIAHIEASCRGVREALRGAAREGAWLSAGPIRPGMRSVYQTGERLGIYAVGNAAGEAHPIVAEGISMAIQSAWLLCEQLIARKDAALATDARAAREAHRAIGRDYALSWRKNFATRIYAAALFAHLAMRPAGARLAVALLKCAPAILTQGAQWSGKVQPLRGIAHW
jgi:menaquinone-9 beta-reductase